MTNNLMFNLGVNMSNDRLMAVFLVDKLVKSGHINDGSVQEIINQMEVDIETYLSTEVNIIKEYMEYHDIISTEDIISFMKENNNDYSKLLVSILAKNNSEVSCG